MKRLITTERKPKNIGVHIYFDREERDMLKAKCIEENISFSAYIRLLARKDLGID